MKSLLERIGSVSDMLNPIVVKELRQAVRSRFIIGIIMLFLVLQVICTAVALASAAVNATFISSPLMYSVGRTLFSSLFTVLALSCLVMIPLYTAIRFASEKQHDSVDLLFITTLSRSAIIRGKLASSCVLTLVIFSACLPFMAFSYLLRGIDLPSIFVTLLFTYLITIVVNQVAILFSSLPISRGFRIVLGLILLGPCVGGFIGVSSLSFAWVQMGIGSRLGVWDFWSGVLLWFGVGASVTLLLYVMSVAFITPPTMNRALPVRLTITGLWLVWGVVAVCVACDLGKFEPLMSWAISSLFVIGLMFLAAISESDRLGNRTLRTIPRRRLNRNLAFLFYNGPAGGILLCMLMAGITVLTCLLVPTVWPSLVSRMSDVTTYTTIMGSCCFYVLAYGLVSLAVRRAKSGRLMQQMATGVLTVIFASVIPIIPAVAIMTARGMSWEAMGPWQLGNIIAVGDPDYRDMHFIFGAVWAVIMLVLHARWLLAQKKAFRHPEDAGGTVSSTEV